MSTDSEFNPGNAPAVAPGAVQPARKASRAFRIWIAIVICVLVALWIETSATTHQTYNLFLSGDSQLLGASVIVDGKPSGAMSGSGSSGLGGSIYYGRVSNGRHKIEIRKQGFDPFVKEIDMRGEDYINVDLNPTKL